jgi:predicted transcriptional regulator
MTQGAMSNYLSSRRGKKYVNILTENTQIMSIITNLVDRIARNETMPDEIVETFCELCVLVRELNLVIDG